MSTKQKGTSAADVRASITEPFEIKMPGNGKSFLVRRVTPYEFVEAGITEIPNDFYKFFAQLSIGKIEKADEAKASESLKLVEKFIDITLAKGCINPPVVMTFKESNNGEALLYTELAPEDQQFLIKHILGK